MFNIIIYIIIIGFGLFCNNAAEGKSTTNLAGKLDVNYQNDIDFLKSNLKSLSDLVEKEIHKINESMRSIKSTNEQNEKQYKNDLESYRFLLTLIVSVLGLLFAVYSYLSYRKRNNQYEISQRIQWSVRLQVQINKSPISFEGLFSALTNTIQNPTNLDFESYCEISDNIQNYSFNDKQKRQLTDKISNGKSNWSRNNT